MTAEGFLKRYVDIDAYAAETADEAEELLLAAEADLDAIVMSAPGYGTKAAATAAESEIKKRTSALSTALQTLALGAAAGIMASQVKWLLERYGFGREPRNLDSFARYTPYNGRDTVQGAVERTARAARAAYSNAVRSAWSFGGSPADAAEAARRNAGSLKAAVSSDFMTMIPSFARFADLMVYDENEDRITGYVCCATLDGRTCIVCGQYHGQRFTDRHKAPGYPLHNRCRCVLIAETEKTGRFEIPDTYEDFIGGLSDEEQRKVLGKTRYNLYKGGMRLDQFVSGARKLRLDEFDISENVKENVENKKTADLVKKLYPKDEFVGKKVSSSATLYVSKNRIRDGLKDITVYKSDKMMAISLAKEMGRDVYLLTERGSGKHPDAFFIDDTLEMKHVTGGLRRVGLNAVRSLKQSANTFIYIEKELPVGNCLEKIKGALKNIRQTVKQNGGQFVEPKKDGLLLVFTQGKLYKYKWADVL